MHLDVSPCQVVTGCFLPTSKSGGAVLSANTYTGLWFPSKKHFNIDTPGLGLLKHAANPTHDLHSITPLADWCASYWPTSLFPKLLYLSQDAHAPGSRGFGNETWQLNLCGRHEQSKVCSMMSYFYENNWKMMFPEPSFPSNAIIKWPNDKIHIYKKCRQNPQSMQHTHKEFWYFLALFLSQNWEI